MERRFRPLIGKICNKQNVIEVRGFYEFSALGIMKPSQLQSIRRYQNS